VQDRPLEKHSQYNFKHCVFLQLQGLKSCEGAGLGFEIYELCRFEMFSICELCLSDYSIFCSSCLENGMKFPKPPIDTGF